LAGVTGRRSIKMRNIIVLGLASIVVSACSTTQREEVRADQSNMEKQERELAAAKRDGTIKEVREEQKDLKDARRELRKDQKILYQPGVDGSPADGLQVGQRESGELFAVPLEYRNQYHDGDGSYYRFDGQRIYRFSFRDRTVTKIYRLDR
jgi:hypothetical protein